MSVLPGNLEAISGAEKIGEYDESDLVCRLHGKLYGVPISSVQEILPLCDILSLPQMPDSILGVGLFRENIIPIVDLAYFMELAGEPPEPEVWEMIVVFHEGKLCALPVQEIDEILNYPSEEIEPLPNVEELDDLFRGIKRMHEEIVTLINIDKLVEQCQLPVRTDLLLQQGTEEQEEMRRISLVRVGDTRIGVDIANIERILRQPEVETIDDASEFIKGVALRPEADPDDPQETDYYPVIDMFKVLGITEPAGKRNVILSHAASILVGYYTGVVEEIRDIAEAAIVPIPPLSHTAANSFIRSVLILEDELVLLIDLAEVLYACGFLER